MTTKITQSNFEQVSAFFDGEMSPDQAAAFQRQLADRPDLARALEQLQGLDRAMNAWAAPAGDEQLASRIVDRVRNHRPAQAMIIRFVRWGGTIAAAAAIIVASTLLLKPKDNDQQQSPIVQAQPASAEVETLCVQNLDLIQNYQVLVDFETLEAIDQIESDGQDI